MVNTTMAHRLGKIHLLLIFIQAIAVGIVGLKVMIRSPKPAAIKTVSSLPKLNLSGWRSLRQENLRPEDLTDIIKGDFLAGEREVLQHESQTLMISHALINNTEGDLKMFIKNYSPDLASTLYFEPQIGHYSQFFQGKYLTMVGCISAQGSATVTADQFKVAQIKSTFSFGQITGWLLNHHTLVPQTCQWRSLSIFPAEDNAAEQLQDIWRKMNTQK